MTLPSGDNKWSFHFRVLKNGIAPKLINFYSRRGVVDCEVLTEPYLVSRYACTLAGECIIEVRFAREERVDMFDHFQHVYPRDPDYVTGTTVVLPLIDGVSPEEALLSILQEEDGYSLRSPAPAWAEDIELPFVPELQNKIECSKAIITREKLKISTYVQDINELQSFRRLLYSTGTELEDIVRRSFEILGSTISPAQYAQEEYILKVGDEEFLVEVKGVSKSISLTNIRQLTDYLLKYQEDTGENCKGILLGNAWRNIPPNMRNTGNTPEFPDNVVERAEQLGISLVSSLTLFDAVHKTLRNKEEAERILKAITTTNGIVQI